ncbi:MAG TPA: alpha-amylase family glycosyl hydrolase, partial [Aggregatilineales bacterium]|nr:alpha-amylase family glycosyl hydrolase [Aggregatilineales bacterium]
PPTPRLDQLYVWIDHILSLNLNAVYLGPVFESSAHGYDTTDYFCVDRRLGDNQTLKNLIRAMKSRGLRVVLDGVFNHVGRDFWAFRDVQANGSGSAYVDWFYNLNFQNRSPYGDSFSYEGWAGHYDLVKLNLQNPQVRQHLFDAIAMWVTEFDIDGLRLDAADTLHHDFMRELAQYCRQLKPDFWLMGEVVHGDYRGWANVTMLDATTNYEGYKGLYSSHVDANYFEIAYSLNRQFGAEGIYKDLLLYSFADNHDVNRVASSLTKPAHLYPLYLLLFTISGVPSIYYGSEWGIKGERAKNSDDVLRPAINLTDIPTFPNPDLAKAIHQFASVRANHPALRYGNYQQLYVAHEQFAFSRSIDNQMVIVAVNASDKPQTITLTGLPQARFIDQLNGQSFQSHAGKIDITLNPHWGSVLLAK